MVYAGKLPENAGSEKNGDKIHPSLGVRLEKNNGLKLGMEHLFGKPQSLKLRFLFPNSFEKILRHSTVWIFSTI